MSAPIKREDIRKGDRVKASYEFTADWDAAPSSSSGSYFTTYELIERPVQLPTVPGVYADRVGDIWVIAEKGAHLTNLETDSPSNAKTWAPFTLLRPVAEVAAEVLAEVRKTMSARQAFMANIDALETKWATK